MKMTTITIGIPPRPNPSYQVHIGSGLMQNFLAFLKKMPLYHTYVIITDTAVKKLYGQELQQAMRVAGYRTNLISFPSGERYKNQATKTKLEETLLRLRCGRDTLIVALGGGVVGDMAGFVAATYMRGVPYLSLPTTLLAMVDSSIGGKTGIDTPLGKNVIGAIWQPQKVIMDIRLLSALSERQLVNGLIEAVKIFFTHDSTMVEFVERRWDTIRERDDETLCRIIRRAVAIKAGIVARDEREDGERMVCNFGHTIGHALEQLSGYLEPHGFAVGAGILVEAKMAEILGVLPAADFQRIHRLLVQIGVTTHLINKYSSREILRVTRTDKKSRGGQPRYVLVKQIGTVHVERGAYAHEVSDSIVREAIKLFS